MTDLSTLHRILRTQRTIAVVGLSADWFRPSYFAAKYMLDHGYRVIPVNPKYPEILGQKAYASLRDIPEPVDMVDVFRKTDDVLPIAREAIAIGARTLWIDSVANGEELSMCGKLSKRFAHQCWTQWEHLAGPDRPRYHGAVL